MPSPMLVHWAVTLIPLRVQSPVTPWPSHRITDGLLLSGWFIHWLTAMSRLVICKSHSSRSQPPKFDAIHTFMVACLSQLELRGILAFLYAAGRESFPINYARTWVDNTVQAIANDVDSRADDGVITVRAVAFQVTEHRV